MGLYLVRRAFVSFFYLFLFISLLFFFIQTIMPTDFVTQFAMTCNAECRAELQAQLGLDLPLWDRYLNWLGQILRGDLGRSFYEVSVISILQRMMPATLLVFLPGTVIAFLLGTTLGRTIAWQRNTRLTQGITFVGTALFTSFPPWLAFLVAYFIQRVGSVDRGFGFNLAEYPTIDRELWRLAELNPDQVATMMLKGILVGGAILIVLNFLIKRLFRRQVPSGILWIGWVAGLLVTWQVTGISELALDMVNAASVALVTYVLLSFGEIMLIMRGSMTQVINEEHVRMARAKALPSNVVRDRHVARNALLPVLSRFAISLPYLLTSIVIIEDAVNWPGIGSGIVSSLYLQDIPFVMAMLLIVGLLSLVVRLAVDVLTAYLDPRIRIADAASVPAAGSRS